MAKRSVCFTILFALALAASGAESVFTIDPLLDGIFLASGIGLSLGSVFLPAPELQIPPSPDPSAAPPLDAALMRPYEATLDAISDYLQYTAAFSPLLLPLFSADFPWLDSGLLALETLSWAYAAKNLVKFALPRLRPWAYFDTVGVPEGVLEEAWESFPSGHTTMAFAGAQVLLVSAILFGEDRPALPWLAAGSLALACGTAALRVASGSHFLSDVAAGALLGSAIGIGATLLHTRDAKNHPEEGRISSLRVEPSPGGIKLTCRF